jgi:hypothetical protein
MVPHRKKPSPSVDPGTFSINHGIPLAWHLSLVSGIRSGCSLAFHIDFNVVCAWHGGLAHMKSNPSSGKVIASA